MANGHPLNDGALTCALWLTNSKGRPLKPDGRCFLVTAGCRSVTVRWTDNGPGSKPRARGVIVDLTPAAMLALAGEQGLRAGRVKVRVEAL